MYIYIIHLQPFVTSGHDSDRSSAMIKLKTHKTINITILFMMYNYDCPSNSVQSI